MRHSLRGLLTWHSLRTLPMWHRRCQSRPPAHSCPPLQRPRLPQTWQRSRYAIARRLHTRRQPDRRQPARHRRSRRWLASTCIRACVCGGATKPGGSAAPWWTAASLSRTVECSSLTGCVTATETLTTWRMTGRGKSSGLTVRARRKLRRARRAGAATRWWRRGQILTRSACGARSRVTGCSIRRGAAGAATPHCSIIASCLGT